MSSVEDGLQIHSSWLKRLFDIILSTIILILFLPLFLLGCVFAKIQSTGPVFYKAKRVGRNAQVFEMYKFRTMVENADKIGIGLTTHKDTRVTSIGRLLRFTKLDELPNFINVIKGDMSLTGPRPESPVYVKFYTDDQRKVLLVRPGITGPSQIVNRNEEVKLAEQTDPEQYYITELLPKKIALDLHYVATQGFTTDIGWILKTLWVLVFPLKVENHTIASNKPTHN
jgi:lipopolysaccharide/colanic/teichoic acid biosynthesis glycosyltransferase